MKCPPRPVTAFLCLLLAGIAALAPGRATAAPGFWGSPGSAPGELGAPMGIAVRSGQVFVADFDNDRIQVFSASGERVGGWGATGREPGQFSGPAGLAIDAAGTVYVADSRNARIQKFDAAGALLGILPTRSGAGASRPVGVAVDRAGATYVTDLDRNLVLRFAPDGTALEPWGGEAVLQDPWGIAVDDAGEVVVADHGNHRVLRFGPDGAVRSSWGARGVGAGDLFGPMGVAIEADGTVLVTDLAGERVQRFAPNGRALGQSMPHPADAATGFSFTALALDGDGGLFVADAVRHRIAHFAVPTLEAGAVVARVPGEFRLASIRPTPSRGPVTLRFAIPAPGRMRADVYSIDGRRVRSFPAILCQAGEALVTWDARDEGGRLASAGMYFVRAQFDDGVHRMLREGRIVVLH